MKTIAFLFAFILAFSAQAQTLLVSDIDDTLKPVHVLDKTEALQWGFKSGSRFAGMTHLYNLIKRDNPDIQFVYLSNAPSWLMTYTHSKFLEKGQFPKGQYINRTEHSSENHKLFTLRELIKKTAPRKVILVGDNGERDVLIYDKIVQEFANKGIEFHQFIRVLYNTKDREDQGVVLKRGQVPFVSPIEISLELEKSSLMSLNSVNWLVTSIIPAFVEQRGEIEEGEIAFPKFVKCNDMVWNWDDSLERYSELKDLKTRVISRCKLK